MKAKWERLVLPLLLATGTAPLPILLGCGNGMPLLLLCPLAYLLAAGVYMLLPGKRRLLAAIVSAVGMLAVGIACLPQALALIMVLAYVILLFATLPAREMLTQTAIFGGMGIHALTQVYLNLIDETLLAALYTHAQTPLTISLLIFLAAALLTMNRASLASAMPEGKGVPETIRRRNRVLTWLMLGAALLVSLLPALSRLLETLWAWLRQVISAVIRWFLSLQVMQKVAGGQPDGGGMDMSSLSEAAPTSALALLLERILLGLTAVVVVLLLGLAAWKLWQKLRMLMRWLFGRLQSYAASATEDYVDEVQDTRTQGEERFTLAGMRRRRLSTKELAALPPRERIRARYGLLRAKHPEWAQSHTVRDTLSGDSARIYERARYSAHEITEQDAGEFLK